MRFRSDEHKLVLSATGFITNSKTTRVVDRLDPLVGEGAAGWAEPTTASGRKRARPWAAGRTGSKSRVVWPVSPLAVPNVASGLLWLKVISPQATTSVVVNIF